ncbi:ATP-binding cassette domain-containing protein [Granulicella sp. L60]|uniref:ATP-binding cassette domain-containing protein n=1 Tax=Granulicella sp. L60 TaxID=1641866 RepID=UPI0020B116E2|nr:ATP-binding cassette domain-containing protein [Granulicella sp. L60]
MSDKISPEQSTSENLLALTMKHRVESLSLDLTFALSKPWTILFGPSGSGKTTVLRTIAGFVHPHTCTLIYGPRDRILVSTEDRLFLPAYQRPIRTAAQAARLFPNRNVKDNVKYGMGGSSHAQAEQEILEQIMHLMRLTTLADRQPNELSGGEKQRVTVARAVAAAVAFDGVEKALLLLDEPFAGLDSVLRDELAIALRDWLSRWKIPVLSVSHDVGECHLLNAEVIRMAEGQVMEQGPAATVLAQERERLLARLG